jgi:hypothetical protein
MLRQRLSSICTILFCVDDLMKPHSPIWVVRKWCGLRADPDLRCLEHLEGLNNGYLPNGCGPRVRELANGLRLGTAVLSKDQSRA